MSSTNNYQTTGSNENDNINGDQYLQITTKKEIRNDQNQEIGDALPVNGSYQKEYNNINRTYQKDSNIPLDLNGDLKLLKPKCNKTIVCWNCLSVLMIKDYWNIVECSECHKFNRIPHDDTDNTKDTHIKVTDNFNHFDVDIPYVFGIITCPFCQTENRFRRDADHIVCYKCHHSFNIKGPGNFNNNIGDYDAYNTRNNYENNKLRFSDMYPNIIGWRGYYPQPIMFNSCDCNKNTEIMLAKILENLKSKKQERPTKIVIPYDRYIPLRRYVHDIDYDDYRERRYTPNYRYDIPAPLPCCPYHKKKENEGFKITIKKKLLDPESGHEIKNSKSTVFEKVLFTGKNYG